VEGQLLCSAENWVKFLILQEGTQETTFINHGRTKFRSWKNMNKNKYHQSDALSPVQCVTAAAKVKQHNCKGYEKK
jgi:hypothetical protein